MVRSCFFLDACNFGFFVVERCSDFRLALFFFLLSPFCRQHRAFARTMARKLTLLKERKNLVLFTVVLCVRVSCFKNQMSLVRFSLVNGFSRVPDAVTWR